MSTPWRSLRDRFTVAGLASLSVAFFLPAALLAQAPTVSGLPESVTGIQAPVPFTGPTGPEYSTFVVSSPATGGPINATGNPYNVWCWNPYGYIQPTPESYTAYSSYDPNFLSLPGAGTGTVAQIATEWQEVNWVINHKHGQSGTLQPTTMDIQYVIWDLLIPGYDTTDLTADGAQLLADAQTYGPSFIPGPGQLLALSLYAGGINLSDGPGSVQDILIEYQLPNTPQIPGIKITKTANVTTAKCSDKVTYTYTVTNTGNVPLTNITVVDDNGTPNYTADDVTVPCGTSLQAGASETCTRTLYLPVTEYGVDAYGNPGNHTLISQVLPDGDIQVTLLEDQNLVDNSYGQASSPDWGSQGNNPWSHIGQDSAEFQFVDGNGNTVLDFAADYVSFSNKYPSGVGTAGIYGGAGHLLSGSASNIVSIDTSITDNLNQNGNAGSWYNNSPPPGYKNWNFQCGYTVVIKSSCFGRYGYGGCKIKNIQHGKCKTGKPYQCEPTPICKTVTNTVVATGTANVNGTNQTVTAKAQASVQLTPGGQQSCQTPPTCQQQPKCQQQQGSDDDDQQNWGGQQQNWNGQQQWGNQQQSGDQQQWGNQQQSDDDQQQWGGQQHGCPPPPCPPPPTCRPQDWWKQCNQKFQQCGRSW